MKKAFRRNERIILTLIELLLGIILLVRPVGFTKTVIVILGLILTLQGILRVLAYCRTEILITSTEQTLAQGLIYACAGLFCMLRSDWIMAAFPVLTVFYGVLILLSGFFKIQWAVDMYRIHIRYWYVALISAVLSLTLAILIILNPFASINALWLFMGVSLIVEAIVDICAYIFGRKQMHL